MGRPRKKWSKKRQQAAVRAEQGDRRMNNGVRASLFVTVLSADDRAKLAEIGKGEDARMGLIARILLASDKGEAIDEIIMWEPGATKYVCRRVISAWNEPPVSTRYERIFATHGGKRTPGDTLKYRPRKKPLPFREPQERHITALRRMGTKQAMVILFRAEGESEQSVANSVGKSLTFVKGVIRRWNRYGLEEINRGRGRPRLQSKE